MLLKEQWPPCPLLFSPPPRRFDYCDEAVKEPGQALPVNIHQPPAFVHKILQLSGILLYYEEFTEGCGGARTPSPVPQVQPHQAVSVAPKGASWRQVPFLFSLLWQTKLPRS